MANPGTKPDKPNRDWPLRAIDIAGRLVEYVDFAGPSANAPCLVLLHGGNCTSEDWDTLLHTLTKRYRVIATDGFVHPIKPWDVWLLLDYLHIQQAALLPHSAGKHIAEGMYRHRPRSVWAIVSVDASIAGQTPLARKMPFDLFTDEAKAMYEAKRNRMMQLKPHHQLDYPSDDPIERRLIAYERAQMTPSQRQAKRPAPDPVAIVEDAPPSKMIANEGRYISCPLLVIVTGGSKLRPDDPAIAECLSQLQATDVQFKLFEHFGHWPWLENQQAFLDVVMPFLADHEH